MSSLDREEPVAANGLLYRRLFLKGGALFTGAAAVAHRTRSSVRPLRHALTIRGSRPEAYASSAAAASDAGRRSHVHHAAAHQLLSESPAIVGSPRMPSTGEVA